MEQGSRCEELLARGWTRPTPSIWRSPEGKLFGGIKSAWDARLKEQKELVERWERIVRESGFSLEDERL
jgi:hypothetical protein